MIQLYNQLELEYKRKLAADILQTSVENIKIEYLYQSDLNGIDNLHLYKPNSLVLIDFFNNPAFDSSDSYFYQFNPPAPQILIDSLLLPSFLSKLPSDYIINDILKGVLLKDFVFINQVNWNYSDYSSEPVYQSFFSYNIGFCVYYYRFSVIK
jgi:hypothetical protein